AVETDAQVVEEQIEAHGPDDVGTDRRAREGVRPALAKLAGTEEIGIAPDRRLRRIAELLERVRAEVARLRVRRIGEDDATHDLRAATVLAAREVLAGPRDGGLRGAHVLDVLPPARHGRERIEGGGVGVVPPEVPLIDGLRIVADRAVVLTHVPRRAK